MNKVVSFLSAITLGLASTSVTAAIPTRLITHNLTDVESNAFIDGIPSTVPTKANSTNIVPWIVVRMACFGHTSPDGKCPATIKMETNTDHPVTLGNVALNMSTGEITPTHLSAYGYTFTVNGLNETTLSRD